MRLVQILSVTTVVLGALFGIVDVHITVLLMLQCHIS